MYAATAIRSCGGQDSWRLGKPSRTHRQAELIAKIVGDKLGANYLGNEFGSQLYVCLHYLPTSVVP